MTRSTEKLIGLLLLFAAAAFSVPSAAQETGGAFDRQFMGKMVHHHQMGIDMAKDCIAKASHDELKGLCQKIASDQQKENGTMRSWLAAWYNDKEAHTGHSEAMMKQGQQMMAKLKGLSGAEYEIRFMNEMSKHHREAVKDSEDCVSRASHPELKNLCTKMVADQRKQIEQMHGWLCSWHKDCHEAASGRGSH